MKKRKTGLIVLILSTMATALYISLIMLPERNVTILTMIGIALSLMWYGGIRLLINPKWGED